MGRSQRTTNWLKTVGVSARGSSHELFVSPGHVARGTLLAVRSQLTRARRGGAAENEQFPPTGLDDGMPT